MAQARTGLPFHFPNLSLGFLVMLAMFSARNVCAERLPGTVTPQHYALALTPDLSAATFEGSETIDVTLAEPSDHITLNAVDIAFKTVTVTAAEKQQTATISLDKDKEEATLKFAEKIPAGKARLEIEYSGTLNDKLRGFYLSKTARRNYAVTQFESTDARRAFPSFDEPAMKATFDVTLTVDAGDTVISNGPIVSDTPGPGAGKHTLTFLTTPKMSTYLVAFLVGDFKCSAGESDGVAVRVCSTPDKVAFTAYGLEIAKYMLHYYDTYFGIPYPLKKLDLIGLPDFEAGAMENFGAITYREEDLLLDEKTASTGAKRGVAVTIAHEMAHQWFGDLVTMKWWDNVWLNEGFATWMENKAVGVMHPEWAMEQEVASSEDDTLNVDAQPTTHAIRAKAETRDEIEEMFDSISYGKASDVLLSVENYLGPETFRKGVHAYLSAHLYANATAEDFWNAQTATSHKPVDKIMDSLISQAGEPLLSFGVPADGKVPVEQKRFFLSPSIQPDPKQKWTVPVCFKSGDSDAQSCEVLTPATTSLKAPSGGLFFANARASGYFRSAYPPSVFAKLVAGAETDLTPAERISLTGDEWAQLRANKATAGDYLNLVTALKADPNAEVVSDALGGVDTIYDRIASTADEKAALAGWIRSTFGPIYARLGPATATDSANLVELRASLFGLLGYYGKDPQIISEASQIAVKYIADPSSVDPNLGQTALSITARNGDEALFDKLQNVAETSSNPEFQEGALRMLAEFENQALEQRSLDYAISGKVRSQDAAIQLAYGLQIDANRDLAWSFTKAHWDKVSALLTPEMGSILVNSAGSFCSASARDDVQSFFTAHPVPAAETSLAHAVERINGCIEMRRLQEPGLRQWLAERAKP